MHGQKEVFTLPLVFRTDPRGMAQIPRNSAESTDPRIPFFWCIVTSPFRTDPHGMMRNLDPFRTDPWKLLGLFRAKYSSHGRGLFFVRVRTDYI